MYKAWIAAQAAGYTWIPVITAALFLGMLCCIETGYRSGRKQASRDSEGFLAGTSVATGALITILSLLLGFTFGSAETRFDQRRAMIVEEANAIGTAYLRLDLLPRRDQPVLRDLFRKYLDARLDAYGSLPDVEKAMSKINRASDLSGEIWKRTVAAFSRAGRGAVNLIVLPAINDMIDIAAARTAALRQHVPILIMLLLCGLSLFCSVLIGFRMSKAGQRNVISAILFVTAVSATFYVTMDLEFPRSGLIRLDPEDRVLIDLQKDLQEKQTK